MKTSTRQRNVALLLSVAALTTMAGSAFAKAGENGGGTSIERPGQGILKRPNFKFKQNDLAAMDLVTTFEGDPTQGTAKLIMVGTCKNLGFKAYQPGSRNLRIDRKVGNAWITQETKLLPALAPGKTFSISYVLPVNDKSTYKLEVTGGPDETPGNDIFIPSAAPVEPPR